NLKTLGNSLRGHDVRVRAHAKTHKCPEIARRQVAAGAIGVCCQKVSEAEAMVEGGIEDVLVSNEVVGAPKLARLAALSTRARLGVCVDNRDNLRQLEASGAKLDVYVELDIGMRRCGVAPGEPALAQAALRGTAGLSRPRPAPAVHGRAQHVRSMAERRAAIQAACDQVV